MHIRPFFWAWLAFVCIAVLVFAYFVTNNQVEPLQAEIAHITSYSTGITLVQLQVSDMESLPIEQATILSSASMPGMAMSPQFVSVQTLGRGSYVARFQLSMAGFWQLGFHISATGFRSAQQVVALQTR